MKRGTGKERVFVGLGSNVGNRLRHLHRAAAALSGLAGTRVVKVSPVFKSSPVGPRQRDFLNAAAEIRTALRPHELLRALKSIERRLGRKRRGRWGPREIDLDILFYGRRVIRTRALTVPHRELRRRMFVLKPLSVLAPSPRLPVSGRRAAELRAGPARFSGTCAFYKNLPSKEP